MKLWANTAQIWIFFSASCCSSSRNSFTLVAVLVRSYEMILETSGGIVTSRYIALHRIIAGKEKFETEKWRPATVQDLTTGV